MLLILQQYGNFGFWGKRKLGKTQQKIGLLPKQTLESPSIHHPKESSDNETNATPHQLMEDNPTYTKIVDSNQSQILQTQIFILMNDSRSHWKVHQSNSTEEETWPVYGSSMLHFIVSWSKHHKTKKLSSRLCALRVPTIQIKTSMRAINHFHVIHGPVMLQQFDSHDLGKMNALGSKH